MSNPSIRQDIFEIHKPSALITAEYKTPIVKGGRIKGYEHYSLTPMQHDAMNFMCYKAREQINKKINVHEKINSFSKEEDLFEFLEVQHFDLNLKELAIFADKYKLKQDKTELSNLLDALQSVQVKVGIFKQDKTLGEIHATKTMSLLRNYTRITNSTHATFQLEPEILLGWIHKTKPFSKMYLKIQTKLKLSYSKILYEICKDYENQGIVNKPFQDWLKVLGFKKELTATKTVGQLTQAYLNKSIKEINECTDIKILSIKGKKEKGIVSMIVEFEKQPCAIIDDIDTTSIKDNKFYNKSKSKLDKLVKGGYKVIDEEMWIGTDIKKNEKYYESEIRIDKWLKETSNTDKNFIYETIAKSIEDCEDPMIVIEDYKILGLFSKYAFTKNPLETIELLNQTISNIEQ